MYCADCSLYELRARIGLIVPSVNGVIEDDFHRMAPAGVSVCTTRARGDEDASPSEYSLSLVRATEGATKILVDAHVDIVVWGMTAGTSINGPTFSDEIVSRIQTVAKLPASTTSKAVVAAFRTMGLRNPAMVTPYPEEYDEAVRNLFTANGIHVANLVGGSVEVKKMTPELAYKRAKLADVPGADSVFISCTAFQAIDVIERLEKELRKPVITSNQATMWEALRMLKINDLILGFGALLSRPRI
jgi:maleate isomerase